MQDARAVANFILENLDARATGITNLKINKILFYIHGWYLLRKNVPLIRNHIEAWQYGPVVKVVYDAFKKYDHSPIENFATFFSYASSKEEVVTFTNDEKIDKDFILRVAQHYATYSASELVDLTHVAGTPWHRTFFASETDRGIRNRISNELILEYFCLIAESRRTQ